MTVWKYVECPPKIGEEVLCAFPKQFGGFVYYTATYHGESYGFVSTFGYFVKPTMWCYLHEIDLPLEINKEGF